MARDHLIFDLDGTISDPAVGIGRSINFALTSFGYPEISEVRVSQYIGPPIDFAERILTLFGLRDYFGFVSGGEVGLHKDAQLKSLIDGAVAARGSIMIGDRAVDVLAARAHGLPSAGVLWGHGSEAELRDAGADQLLELPSEIGELRDRIRTGARPSA